MAAPAPAARSLHLRLQVEPQGPVVTGLLISPSGTACLPALCLDPCGSPGHLQGLLQKWQRALRACYVLQLAEAQRQRVQECAEELLASLRSRCLDPSWAALGQTLAHYLHLPLVLEIAALVDSPGPPDPAALWLEALPWEEALAGLIPQGGPSPSRPIWRVRSLPLASPPHRPAARSRRPRVLLVCGPDDHLHLQPQIDQLRRLHRRGRIVLTRLAGSTCRASAVLECLTDPLGWDAVLYLGHGEPGTGYGGGLALPSGELLAGDRLRIALHQAAPQLVLLSRCHGSDLVPLCLEAGVPWVLAFRGEVPDPLALAAFTPFWQALETGATLAAANASAAEALEGQFPGSSPLLSLVARVDAEPLQFPLRRRRRWRLRLARSQRRQLAATAAVLTLGLGVYGPSWGSAAAFSIPNALLEFRLQAQARWGIWRRGGRPGLPPSAPGASPLRVWLLPAALAYPPGPPPSAASRQVLRQLLEALPADTIPLVALDVVLDPGETTRPLQPQATAELARLIRQRSQRGQGLLNIYYPPGSAGRGQQGDPSRAAPQLRAAGLCDTDASLAIASSLDPASRLFPLQLVHPLRANTFAAALADGAASRCPSAPAPVRLPAGSVIDWTLDWFHPQVIGVERLGTIPSAPAPLPPGTRVLIGIDHRPSAQGVQGLPPNVVPDLFPVPLALVDQPSLHAIGLGEELPGPLLQAVFSESLRRGHWFTPLAPLPTTALAAGLGVLLAAVFERWRIRLVVVLLLSLLALPVGLELAFGLRLLVPLLLPLAGLWASCLIRQEERR